MTRGLSIINGSSVKLILCHVQRSQLDSHSPFDLHSRQRKLRKYFLLLFLLLHWDQRKLIWLMHWRPCHVIQDTCAGGAWLALARFLILKLSNGAKASLLTIYCHLHCIHHECMNTLHLQSGLHVRGSLSKAKLMEVDGLSQAMWGPLDMLNEFAKLGYVFNFLCVSWNRVSSLVA